MHRFDEIPDPDMSDIPATDFDRKMLADWYKSIKPQLDEARSNMMLAMNTAIQQDLGELYHTCTEGSLCRTKLYREKEEEYQR